MCSIVCFGSVPSSLGPGSLTLFGDWVLITQMTPTASSPVPRPPPPGSPLPQPIEIPLAARAAFRSYCFNQLFLLINPFDGASRSSVINPNSFVRHREHISPCLSELSDVLCTQMPASFRLLSAELGPVTWIPPPPLRVPSSPLLPFSLLLLLPHLLLCALGTDSFLKSWLNRERMSQIIPERFPSQPFLHHPVTAALLY